MLVFTYNYFLLNMLVLTYNYFFFKIIFVITLEFLI